MISYFKNGEPSISTTSIDDSLVGHLVVYDADKSLFLGEPVKFDHKIWYEKNKNSINY